MTRRTSNTKMQTVRQWRAGKKYHMPIGHNHRRLTPLTTWATALSHSMKPQAMPCRATRDGQVTAESSDQTWSTRQGNGKPLQYSCLENPMKPQGHTESDTTERLNWNELNLLWRGYRIIMCVIYTEVAQWKIGKNYFKMLIILECGY